MERGAARKSRGRCWPARGGVTMQGGRRLADRCWASGRGPGGGEYGVFCPMRVGPRRITVEETLTRPAIGSTKPG
jgi:hypothetical protein